MMDKRTIGLAAATLLGVGAVIVGGLVSGEGYISNLLLQVGSSLVLLIPLVLLGRVIEDRIKEADTRTREVSQQIADVAHDVQQTADQVDAIGRLTRERLREAQSDLDDQLLMAEVDPSQHNIAVVLAAATDARALSPAGLRFRLGPLTDHWLRFSLDGSRSATLLTVESRDTALATRIVWHNSTPAQALFATLTSEMRTFEVGVEEIDSSAILRRLIGDIKVALSRVEHGDVQRWGPLIEIVGANWAVATGGLCRLDRHFGIPANRLLNAREDWRAYVLRNSWADADESTEALRTAVAVYRAAGLDS